MFADTCLLFICQPYWEVGERNQNDGSCAFYSYFLKFLSPLVLRMHGHILQWLMPALFLLDSCQTSYTGWDRGFCFEQRAREAYYV